jgi:hypothetical protein
MSDIEDQEKLPGANSHTACYAFLQAADVCIAMPLTDKHIYALQIGCLGL